MRLVREQYTLKNLTAIYNIGLQPGMSPEDAKYTGMCNLGALFFIFLVAANMMIS